MSTKAFPIRIALVIGCAFAAVHCGEEAITDGPTDERQNQGCGACTGESVCIEDVCEDAFPRFYTIDIERVIFPTNKSDGSCWDDPGCGAPDAQIEIMLNDDKVAELETDDDAFDVGFSDSIELQLISGSKLEIRLEEEDLVDNEHVMSCTFDPLTGETVRSGNIGCTDGSIFISAMITARGGNNP